jgi:hypothetical protein
MYSIADACCWLPVFEGEGVWIGGLAATKLDALLELLVLRIDCSSYMR